MALTEIGARISLRDRARFERDARRAAGAVDGIADAANRADRDLTGMERAAARAGRVVGTALGRGIGGTVRSAGALSKVMGVGLVGGVAAAGLALPLLGKSLLDTATQLEAVRQKAGIVFGTALPGVTRWAEKSAAKMGLTTSEAVGLAASMGDLLIPMGFAREQAARMSSETVNLAGALAQWSGGQYAAADVAGILTDAMLGETDSLKGLGIAISADDIAARLAAKGQSKLTGAVMQQASALATQELILEKSTDAQTAFAKGGLKLAGTQGRIRAVLQTVREQLATRAAPYLLQALEGFEQRLPAIQRALGAFASGALPGIKQGLADFSDSLGQLKAKADGVGDGSKARSLGEVVGTAMGTAITLIGKYVVVLQDAAVKFVEFSGTALRTVSSLSFTMAGIFANLAKVPGPMRETFRSLAQASADIGLQASRTATALDNLAKPRTATITLRAAGVAAVQARLDRLDRPPSAPRPSPPPTTGRLMAAVPPGRSITGRATGGSVMAGRPYVVGERGPEFFRPQVSGNIVNQRQAAEAVVREGQGGGAPVELHATLVLPNGEVLTRLVTRGVQQKAARR